MISRVPSHGLEIWLSGPELCASIGLLEEASPKGDVRRRDSVRLSVLGPSTGLRVSPRSRNTDLARRCQPVCMQTTGVTRTKVGDYKCSGEKPTHCSCRCYYGGLGIQFRTVLSFYLIPLVQDFCWDGSLTWQRRIRSVRDERAEEDAQV